MNSRWAKRPALAKQLWVFSSEGLHRPDIIGCSMLQNINRAIVGPNLEATVSNAVPLVEDFSDLVGPPRRSLRREA